MQGVYEFLLKIVIAGNLSQEQVLKFMGRKFYQQMLEGFNSEDPRERDYLKTLLHRIYGKFVTVREIIRSCLIDQFLAISYELES